jgi:hypothetical protein
MYKVGTSDEGPAALALRSASGRICILAEFPSDVYAAVCEC